MIILKHFQKVNFQLLKMNERHNDNWKTNEICHLNPIPQTLKLIIMHKH